MLTCIRAFSRCFRWFCPQAKRVQVLFGTRIKQCGGSCKLILGDQIRGAHARGQSIPALGMLCPLISVPLIWLGQPSQLGQARPARSCPPGQARPGQPGEAGQASQGPSQAGQASQIRGTEIRGHSLSSSGMLCPLVCGSLIWSPISAQTRDQTCNPMGTANKKEKRFTRLRYPSQWKLMRLL